MITDGKYILDKNGNPRECKDLLKWAKWFEISGKNRMIGWDVIGNKNKTVSTVFLGLDHSFSRGRLLLYETIIFNKDNSYVINRYPTKKEAIKGHKFWVTVIQRLPYLDAFNKNILNK